MPLTLARREEIAKTLHDARLTGTPIPPLRNTDPEITLEDAYAIQELNIRRRIEEESPTERRMSKPIGYKVGLTSTAVQSWLGVDEPDFGALLPSMSVPNGGAISTANLLNPKAEGELAFVLRQELWGAVTQLDVIQAIDYILPCIEVIDSRVEDWDIKIVDTVADNASASHYVLGNRPCTIEQIDVQYIGMALRKNGRVVSTGCGVASLGNPLNAIAWLARTLSRMGTNLKAGDVILSGALGPVVDVAAGDVVEVQVGAEDRVSVRFVA